MYQVIVFSCSLSIQIANCYVKQGLSVDLLGQPHWQNVHQLFSGLLWKDVGECRLTSDLFFLFPRVMITRRAASVKLAYFA